MTPLSYQMIEENGWLYTDIQAEEILQSSEFILLHDFGKDKKFILFKPSQVTGQIYLRYNQELIDQDYYLTVRTNPELVERYSTTTINPDYFGTVTFTGNVTYNNQTEN